MIKAYDQIGEKVDQPEVYSMNIEQNLGATQATYKDMSKN